MTTSGIDGYVEHKSSSGNYSDGAINAPRLTQRAASMCTVTVILEITNGWVLIACEGQKLGYIQGSAHAGLQ